MIGAIIGFCYCMFVGLNARKTRAVPVLVFIVFPVIFIGYSSYELLNLHFLKSVFFFGAFCCCFIISYIKSFKVDIQINKSKKAVVVPGSWNLFFCLMSIFILRFSHGYLINVDQNFMIQYENIWFFARGVVSGFLFGRAFNFLKRYLFS